MQEDNMILRSAAAGDAEKMAKLDALCFKTPWSIGSFKSELTENNLAIYVCMEKAGEVIGYAGLWKIVDEGHITNVAVHPEYRRRGLARKMLTKLFETANLLYYTLEVRTSNIKAIKLYASFGFLVVGKRKEYYENNEDALIMWLRSERENDERR